MIEPLYNEKTKTSYYITVHGQDTFNGCINLCRFHDDVAIKSIKLSSSANAVFEFIKYCVTIRLDEKQVIEHLAYHDIIVRPYRLYPVSEYYSLFFAEEDIAWLMDQAHKIINSKNHELDQNGIWLHGELKKTCSKFIVAHEQYRISMVRLDYFHNTLTQDWRKMSNNWWEMQRLANTAILHSKFLAARIKLNTKINA